MINAQGTISLDGQTINLGVQDINIYGVHALHSRTDPSGANPIGRRADRKTKQPDARLDLRGRSFSDSKHGLEHPEADPCLWFIITAGAKALLGQPSRKEYVWYNDKFWRRATNGDVGFAAKAGLKRVIGGRLVVWLYEEQILNRPEVYDQVMALLGSVIHA